MVKVIKKIYRCEHCYSYYEVRKRALKCAEDDLKRIFKRLGKVGEGSKPMITKLSGLMKEELK